MCVKTRSSPSAYEVLGFFLPAFLHNTQKRFRDGLIKAILVLLNYQVVKVTLSVYQLCNIRPLGGNSGTVSTLM